MSSFKRTCTALAGQRHSRLTAVVFALAVSGCSADVTRFDNPGFNLTENNDRPGAAQPGAPRRNGYDDQQPYPQSQQQPPPRAGLTGEPLPPPERTATLPPPSYDRGRPSAAAPIERRPPPPAPRAVASGETVEVQSGDTLYSLARRHNVPVSQLIEVNNLGANSTIKPGQKLALPAGAHGPSDPAPGRPVAPRIPVAKAPTAAPQSTPTPGWDHVHTLKSGESLYGVARQYRVTLEELQRVNGITEPTRVRMGAKLRVPGAPEQPRTAYTPPPGNDPIAEQPTVSTPSVTPRVLNGQRKAAVENRANDAEPVAPAAEPAAGARFSWPARGRVLAGFGKRPDGTHNDGVNLSVPMGTNILAAEGGRVAYAGSDIQAYGNLILIRHDNGWVSAYAHADKILVQRDEVVRRGQVIAKAGRTGTVDQPQVHFELRQGAKPVDPMPHMER